MCVCVCVCNKRLHIYVEVNNINTFATFDGNWPEYHRDMSVDIFNTLMSMKRHASQFESVMKNSEQ